MYECVCVCVWVCCFIASRIGQGGVGRRGQERVTVCKVACFIATRIALDERRNGVVRLDKMSAREGAEQ